MMRLLLLYLFGWLKGFFRRDPIKLVIVRRYQDANGSYVGELYMYEVIQRKHAGGTDTVTGYRMIGASLDTLPFEADRYSSDGLNIFGWTLDTRNDFLAPIMPCVVRVGALEPKDNDGVRQMLATFPRSRTFLQVQNRFIETVLGEGRR